jgi:hypothetical protein
MIPLWSSAYRSDPVIAEQLLHFISFVETETGFQASPSNSVLGLWVEEKREANTVCLGTSCPHWLWCVQCWHVSSVLFMKLLISINICVSLYVCCVLVILIEYKFLVGEEICIPLRITTCVRIVCVCVCACVRACVRARARMKEHLNHCADVHVTYVATRWIFLRYILTHNSRE